MAASLRCGHLLVGEPGALARNVADTVPSRTTVTLFFKNACSCLNFLVSREPEVIDEQRAAEMLRHEDIEILVQLGTGEARARH